MAIQFARTEIISAGTGSSVVGLSAYIAREDRRAEATDRAYGFAHRDDDLEYLKVHLPENAPSWMSDARQLWNAVEAKEITRDRKTGELRFKRNAQLAKHTVLALPKELDASEQREVLERFVRQNYTSKGVAVEAAIHRPHEGGENWHAHLVVTTREITGDGIGKKARHLNPGFIKGRTSGDEIGQRWADFQNAYFIEKGLNLTVDTTAAVPNVHMKAGRFVENSDVQKENDTRRTKHAHMIIQKPHTVTDELTRNKPYFTERDVSRYLFKAGLESEEFDRAKTAVMAQALPLYERKTGRATDKYTTEHVRRQEREILKLADSLNGRNRHRVSARQLKNAMHGKGLKDEQIAAYHSAVDNGHDLSIWRGVAGTGKSRVMNIAREAYERGGYNVIGLAPTNTVARDMERDGFSEARTAHSFLARMERGTQRLDSSSVLFVDEAAMMDNERLGAVLKHANKAHAKVILIGDDRQLASIERGGMFTAIREKYGASELRQVRRQRDDWAKQSSLDFADGYFEKAVRAYEDHGRIAWASNIGETKKQLIEAWSRDTDENTAKLRFVYAQTNKDVNEINSALRQVRIGRGELGPSKEFQTVRGKIEVAERDRIQFYDNDRETGIFNGYVGTVEKINGSRVSVRLDNGREVNFDAERFNGFGHGYAGTVYRGQGKTQPETYYLHTPLSDSRTSYVAMTRHTDKVSLFVSRETTPDVRSLARQMDRENDRGPSIRFATKDELAREQKPLKRVFKRPKKQQEKENTMSKPTKSTPKKGDSAAAQALRKGLAQAAQEKKKRNRLKLDLKGMKPPTTEHGKRLVADMKDERQVRSRKAKSRDMDMEG